MNKKGDVFQLLFVLILIFIIAVVGILFTTMTIKVHESWTDSGLLNDTAIGTNANDLLQRSAPNTFDYMVFFFFLGSIIGLCISAVRTNFSPTIIFMFLLLLVITIFVASGIVNIYSGFASVEPLNETAALTPLTMFIFSKYLPLIMASMGGIIMLIMWGRSGSDIIT